MAVGESADEEFTLNNDNSPNRNFDESAIKIEQTFIMEDTFRGIMESPIMKKDKDSIVSSSP